MFILHVRICTYVAFDAYMHKKDEEALYQDLPLQSPEYKTFG